MEVGKAEVNKSEDELLGKSYLMSAVMAAPLFIGLSLHAFIAGLVLGLEASLFTPSARTFSAGLHDGPPLDPLWTPSGPPLDPLRWSSRMRTDGWVGGCDCFYYWQRRRGDVVLLCWVIVSHKGPETLSLAVKFIKEGMSVAHTFGSVVAFSCVTPLGIAAGTTPSLDPLSRPPLQTPSPDPL
eukprot:3596922-Pyramimonas_sp.AAC.1